MAISYVLERQAQSSFKTHNKNVFVKATFQFCRKMFPYVMGAEVGD